MESFKSILDVLKRTVTEKFWGEVIIKFKDGKPVFVKTVETIRVD